MGWTVESRTGDAAALHAWEPARPGRRVVRCEVTAPAIVLGSTQDAASVVSEVAVPVVRRRSGGGAVAVAPGEQLWVEVLLPAADRLWRDDVEAATWWLGRSWAAAFEEVLGAGTAVVHERGVTDRAVGRLACFAAMGPGEVMVGEGKALGISQRRTRGYARFQCLVCGPGRQDVLRSVLLPAAPGAGQADLDVALDRVLGWDAVTLDAVFEAFLAHLPA